MMFKSSRHLVRLNGNGDISQTIDRNILIDRQDIGLFAGQNRNNAGQNAGEIFDGEHQRDHAAARGLIKRQYSVLVFIVGAAGQADAASGQMERFGLGAAEQTFDGHNFVKNFWQNIRFDQKKFTV